MKSLYYNQSGNVLEVRDIPMPERAKGESLIRVLYAGICNTDIEIIKGYMGYEGVLGHEFVGIVEESDDSLLTGRRVVGEININCGKCDLCRQGMGNHCQVRSVLGILGKDGCFTQYITMPDQNLRIIPDNISDINAVFIEPLAAALRPLDQVSLKKGASICVLGDGKLGILSAIVYSHYFDDVILMGKHEGKLNKASHFGIRTMIFDKDHSRFDVIIECTGKAIGIVHALDMLRPGGNLILKTTSADSMDISLSKIVIDEITITGSRCGNFDRAISFLEKGIDLSSLVSRVFPLEEGIEAVAYSKKRDIIKVLLNINNIKNINGGTK